MGWIGDLLKEREALCCVSHLVVAQPVKLTIGSHLLQFCTDLLLLFWGKVSDIVFELAVSVVNGFLSLWGEERLAGDLGFFAIGGACEALGIVFGCFVEIPRDALVGETMGTFVFVKAIDVIEELGEFLFVDLAVAVGIEVFEVDLTVFVAIKGFLEGKVFEEGLELGIIRGEGLQLEELVTCDGCGHGFFPYGKGFYVQSFPHAKPMPRLV